MNDLLQMITDNLTFIAGVVFVVGLIVWRVWVVDTLNPPTNLGEGRKFTRLFPDEKRNGKKR